MCVGWMSGQCKDPLPRALGFLPSDSYSAVGLQCCKMVFNGNFSGQFEYNIVSYLKMSFRGAFIKAEWRVSSKQLHS